MENLKVIRVISMGKDGKSYESLRVIGVCNGIELQFGKPIYPTSSEKVILEQLEVPKVIR